MVFSQSINISNHIYIWSLGALSEAPTMTPSAGMRPGNPTPAHATGQGSPSPLRPKNPTPAHAGKIMSDRPGELFYC